MQLSDYITAQRVISDMGASSKREALEELAALLVRGRNGKAAEELSRAFEERERLASTGVGEGVAIPHARTEAVDRLVVGLGRSVQGIDFGSVDGRPARLFFAIAAPASSTNLHLKVLARISKLCREPAFREAMLGARDDAQMYEILLREDRKYSV